MTRLYETYSFDGSGRDQIDYGTARTLFPRLGV
jgi:hypothetical protein